VGDLFEALANPVRRQILTLLRAQNLSAGDIADRLPVAKSTLSQHFNVLKAADLIRATRSGTTITYSLNASVVEEGVMEILRLLKPEKKTKGASSWTRRSALAGSSSRSR